MVAQHLGGKFISHPKVIMPVWKLTCEFSLSMYKYVLCKPAVQCKPLLGKAQASEVT